ncbi:copper resistance CopC family protein [Neobacillus niacini]|uniref:copper resistance CopC family protein n=1 Tax=Neobacillus niacini TaxID=86668 RepID=UPI002FFF6312
MLNKITLLSLLVFFIFGANVLAHSHLEDSTPKNGEIVTEALKTITLSFETDLEFTSSFTLLDEKNTAIPLSTVSINGNQLVANVENELLNGSYMIHWKIIGEDGHPLEGDVPFSVQLPENTIAPDQVEPTVSDKTVTTVTESATDTETVLKEQATETKAAVSNEPSMMNYLLPAIIGLLIILGFGSYWLIYKRKQV